MLGPRGSRYGDGQLSETAVFRRDCNNPGLACFPVLNAATTGMAANKLIGDLDGACKLGAGLQDTGAPLACEPWGVRNRRRGQGQDRAINDHNEACPLLLRPPDQSSQPPPLR